MTGVRLAAAVALILAITAELVIGAPGSASRSRVAQSERCRRQMYALIVVTGLLGVADQPRHARGSSAARWPGTRPVRGGGGGVNLIAGRRTPWRCPLLLVALWWVLTSAGSTELLLPAAVDDPRGVRRHLVRPERWSTTCCRAWRGSPSASRPRPCSASRSACSIGPLGCVPASAEPVLEFFRAIPPPVLVPVLMLFARHRRRDEGRW